MSDDGPESSKIDAADVQTRELLIILTSPDSETPEKIFKNDDGLQYQVIAPDDNAVRRVYGYNTYQVDKFKPLRHSCSELVKAAAAHAVEEDRKRHAEPPSGRPSYQVVVLIHWDQSERPPFPNFDETTSDGCSYRGRSNRIPFTKLNEVVNRLVEEAAQTNVSVTSETWKHVWQLFTDVWAQDASKHQRNESPGAKPETVAAVSTMPPVFYISYRPCPDSLREIATGNLTIEWLRPRPHPLLDSNDLKKDKNKFINASGAWSLGAYQHLASVLQQRIPAQRQQRRTVCLLDVKSVPADSLSDWKQFSPTIHGDDHQPLAWTNCAAMLILTFPDVYWILIADQAPNGPTDKFQGLNAHYWDGKDAKALSRHLDCAAMGIDDLFDATGLLNDIFTNINQDRKQNEPGASAPILQRGPFGVSIDEEESYAFLHAYALYSVNLRACAITSWEQTELFLTDQEAFTDSIIEWKTRIEAMRRQLWASEQPVDVAAAITDFDLQFPDKPTTGPSRWDEKAAGKPLWANLSHKTTLVVTGVTDESPNAVNKPTDGLISLSEKLLSLLVKKANGAQEETITPTTDPAKTHTTVSKTRANAHSAPGRLQVVAESLAERARRLLNGATTVREAITAAQLCRVASDLLAGLTPTALMELLALRHRAEVTAESMFYGVNADLDTEKRLKHMEREVREIAELFGDTTRVRSQLTSEIRVVDELTRVYREYNQFNAEMVCVNRARRLRGVLTLHFKGSDGKRFEPLDTAMVALLSLALFWIIYRNAEWIIVGMALSLTALAPLLIALALLVISVALLEGWDAIVHYVAHGKDILQAAKRVILSVAATMKTRLRQCSFPVRRGLYCYRDYCFEKPSYLAKSLVVLTLSSLIFFGVVARHKDKVDEKTMSVPTSAGLNASAGNPTGGKASPEPDDMSTVERAERKVGFAVYDTVSALVSGQPPADEQALADRARGPLILIMACLFPIIGVTHMGLLMALIYTRISRR